MSDFLEIIKVVTDAVRFVFNTILDVVSLAVFLGLCCVPWRILENSHNLNALCSDSDIKFADVREMAAFSLMLLIVDAFSMPMMLLSLLSPLRWSVFNKMMTRYLESMNSNDVQYEVVMGYSLKLRGAILNMFLFGFCVDIICLPIGCLLLLMTLDWRYEALWLIAKSYDVRHGNYPRDTSDQNEFYTNMVSHLFFFSMGGFFTTIMCIPLVPLLILIPTIWGGAYHGYLSIAENRPQDYHRDVDDFVESWSEKVFEDVKILIVNLTCHALTDIAALPFLLFALFSPIRRKPMLEKLFPRPPDPVETIQTAESQPPNHRYNGTTDASAYEFFYDLSIRKEIFHLGFLGIGDLFALPIIGLLWLTRYRYPIVLKAMQATTTISLEVYGTVYKQGFLLFIDLLVLSWTVPILYLTRVRWSGLRDNLIESNFQDHNDLIYLEAIGDLLQLLLDVVCFPFTAIVLGTWYRSKSLRIIWQHDDLWRLFGLFNLIALINFGLLIHDLILLPPALLLSSITLCRIPVVYALMREEISSWSIASTEDNINAKNVELAVIANDEAIAINVQANENAGIAIDEVYEDQLVRSTDNPSIDAALASTAAATATATVHQSYKDNLYGLIFDMSSIRSQLWMQVSMSIVDMIHLPIVFVVVISYWRSHELFRNLVAIDPELSYVDHLKWGKTSMKLWYIIDRQLLLLFRDLVFLLPFSIIMATLYRFPGVIASMLSKASARAMTDEAVYEIASCLCTFPPIGAPLLNMKVRAKETSTNSWDPTKPVSFHVIGESLWKNAGITYGNGIIAIARSMLPLKLRDKDGIGLSDFLSSTNYESDELDLWLKLDFGIAKSTSLLWKLKRLPMDVRVTMQFEAIRSDGTKAVLCRISPSVLQILDMLKLGTATLPLEAMNIPFTLTMDEISAEEDNLVNSFYLIIGKAFVEIILDLIFFFMAIVTIFSPYRFFSMLLTLFEHHLKITIRKVAYAKELLNHADDHLLAYRRISEPLTNNLVKSNISSYLRNAYQLDYLHEGSTAGLTSREKFHITGYRRLGKQIENLVAWIKGCEEYYRLIKERFELHSQLLLFWYLACASYMVLTSNSSRSPDSDQGADAAEKTWSAITVFTEERYKVGIQLSKNTAALRKEITRIHQSISEDIKNSKKKSSIGLFHRSIADSRSLVGFSFIQMLKDIGFLFLGLLLLCSGIRSIAILRDLIQAQTLNPASYVTRSIIKQHVMEIRRDLHFIGIIVMNLFVLVITAIGLPSLIIDIPTHLDSLESFAECTILHRKKLTDSILEVLTLFFVWKTYKVVMKSTILAFFVPGACLAEALPFTSLPVNARFAIGMVIWCCYLIGALVTVYGSMDTTQALLILSAAIFALILAASFSVSFRPAYLHPRFASIRIPSLSWSHILALITGPFEVIQLSAVIMYFFWLSPASSGSTSPMNYYGSDNLSSSLLQWNRGSIPSHNRTEYRASTSVACAAIFAWTILISLPLTANFESSVEYRQKKLQKFRESALYEFFMILLSRLFTVWLIATLMRPTSCVDDHLTTAFNVSCTPDDYWTTSVALVVLVYYLLTSSILHADDADLLNNQSSGAAVLSNSVTFSPIYASWIRCGQLAILAAAMGTPWYSPSSQSTNTPLIFILVLSIIIAFCPVALPSADVCSFLAVILIRSASYLSVAWTAFICLVRYNRTANENEESLLQSETTIYVGWAILHLIAIAIAIYLELAAYRSWINYLTEKGVFVVIDEMFEKLQSIFVNELQVQSSSGNNVAAHQQRLQSPLLMMKKKLDSFHYEAKQSRSMARLIHLLIKLEESISFNCLTSQFLYTRKSWRGQLEVLIKNSLSLSTIEQHYDIDSQLSSVMMSMTVLSHSCLTDASTRVNRQILLILLSRRFPMEVCINIMTYMQNTSRLREILLTPLEDIRRSSTSLERFRTVDKPVLHGKREHHAIRSESVSKRWLSYSIYEMELRKKHVEAISLAMVNDFEEARNLYIDETTH
jgi:hypothetical protein